MDERKSNISDMKVDINISVTVNGKENADIRAKWTELLVEAINALKGHNTFNANPCGGRSYTHGTNTNPRPYPTQVTSYPEYIIGGSPHGFGHDSNGCNGQTINVPRCGAEPTVCSLREYPTQIYHCPQHIIKFPLDGEF